MSKASKHDKRPPEPETVSDKISTAYADAREKASSALSGGLTQIEGNPLAALLGGLVLGAVAGALLPRSDREKDLLAPLGERVGEAARAALAAGRSAGQGALAESGFNMDNAREQARRLFDQLGSTAGRAGFAALQAARDSTRR